MNPLMVQQVQATAPIGITTGGGVPAPGVDGVTGQDQGGHPMALERVLGLGSVQDQDLVQGMDMGQGVVVVLMVVGMDQEVGLATLLAVVRVVATAAVNLRRRMLGT